MNKKQFTFYAFMLTFCIACGDGSVKNYKRYNPIQDDNVTQDDFIDEPNEDLLKNNVKISKFQVGDKVLRNYQNQGWCPGKIQAVEINMGKIKYCIKYDDEKEESNVEEGINSIMSQPKFQFGDTVVAISQNQRTSRHGVIQSTGISMGKIQYFIKYSNGDTEDHVEEERIMVP